MNLSDLTIGFELEYKGLDATEDFTLLWDNLHSFGDIMEEGSLAGESFELVSPVYDGSDFTSNSVNRKISNLFNKLAMLRRIFVDDSTGLHFHIGRSILEPESLHRLFELVYHPEFRRLLIKVGGRSLNNYCRGRKPSAEDIAAPYKYSCSRNIILNPHGNGGLTLEFRHARCTTSLDNFLAKAQFSIALIHLAIEEVGLTQKKFLDFVERNDYLYPNLVKLLYVLNEYPTTGALSIAGARD